MFRLLVILCVFALGSCFLQKPIPVETESVLDYSTWVDVRDTLWLKVVCQMKSGVSIRGATNGSSTIGYTGIDTFRIISASEKDREQDDSIMAVPSPYTPWPKMIGYYIINEDGSIGIPECERHTYPTVFAEIFSIH